MAKIIDEGFAAKVQKGATGGGKVSIVEDGPEASNKPVPEFVFKEVFQNEENKKAIVEFLSKEAVAVRNGEGRAEFLRSVEKWKRQRQAKPATATKDYPFPGSANVSPPLMLTRGNTIYAKLLSNYSTKRPFWSGESDDAMFEDHAKAVAKLMNYYSKSKFHLNLKSVNKTMLYDLVYLGTQFYRVSWKMERFKAGGEGAGDKMRFRKNTPEVSPIAIEDFLTRTYWTDIQSMPWCGVRYMKSWREIVDEGAQGYYDPKAVEELKAFSMQTPTSAEKNAAERAGVEVKLQADIDATAFYELFECYVFWDVDGDGQLEDVLVTFEATSGTVLRATLNDVGWRLFGRLTYLEIPGQLYGVGVGRLLEPLQDEADTLRNLRLDGIGWAMLGMWKRKKGSSVKVGERLEKGKVWNVDEMDDIAPLVVQDVSQTTLPAEQITSRDADLASGANEAMGGFADSTLKSGGGAEAQQVLMEQGFSVLNMYLDGVDDSYTEIGRMILLVMHRNKDLVDFAGLSPTETALVREVFEMPIEELPSRFRFNIETTDLARNETSMKSNYAMFSQMFKLYVDEVGEAYAAYVQAQAQGDPFMMGLASKLIIGKTKVMEKMIEFLHIGKPSDYLPDITMFETGAQNGQNGTELGGPAAPGAGVPGAGAGMGAIPAGAGGMASLAGGGFGGVPGTTSGGGNPNMPQTGGI